MLSLPGSPEIIYLLIHLSDFKILAHSMSFTASAILFFVFLNQYEKYDVMLMNGVDIAVYVKQ